MAEWITDSVLQLETDYGRVADFPMWMYVVRGSDRSAVIDTCVPSTYSSAVVPQLALDRFDVRQVTAILNTHGHPDHFGGNASWLEAVPEAEIYAPLADAPWVEDHDRHWSELWDNFPGCLNFDSATRAEIMKNYCGDDTRVAHTVRDGDVVDLGDKSLTAIRTGAHSPDHMAYYDSADRLLFCGDVVQGAGASFLKADTALAPLYDDPDEYVAGIKRLMAVDFAWLLPSHRQPLTGDDARALLERSITFVDEVEALVDEIDRTGTISTASLASAIGTRLGRFGGVTLQTASIAQGHLRRRVRSGGLHSPWTLSSRQTPRQ